MKKKNSMLSFDQDELLNNLPDAVLEIDLDTRDIIKMNRMAHILFGFDRSDLEKGLNATKVLNDSEYERLANYLKAFAQESYQNKTAYKRSGRYETYDVRMLKKDKSEFIAEAQGLFILDDSNIPTGLRAILRDVTKFRNLEISQRRRGNILNAINYTTKLFLNYLAWDKYIEEVLSRIGKAAEVSRAYIFTNDHSVDGEVLTSEQFEWVNAGIESQIRNPDFQNIPLKKNGLAQLIKKLGKGEIVAKLIKDFPEYEQLNFGPQKVLSILLVPIFVDGEWWGQIGFDDCVEDRIWSGTTIKALQTAAEMIGATLVRKKAEEELDREREKYRTILDTIEEGYFELDLAGNFVFVNDSICRLSGYQMDELLGLNNRDYTTPETAARMYKEFSDLYNSGGTKEIADYEIIKKDGSIATLELSTILKFAADGKPIGFRGVTRDVTLQRRARQLLQESEQRFQNLYNQAPDMYFSLNPAGIIISVNQFGADYLGYSKEELIGKPVEMIIHPYELPTIQARVAEIFTNKIINSDLELRKIRKNGSVIHVHERSQLILDDENNPVELRLICRDITENKLAQEQRELALEQAQRSDKVKSLFLANMSHEIRTPLNSILGFSDLIEERLKSFAKDDEQLFFKIIRRSGKRLMRTIHEILDISEIEAGAFNIEFENVNLNKIVKNICEELLPEAKEKYLDLFYINPEAPIFIVANDYCVSQALMNIIDNAIKYTPNGKIEIRIEQKQNKVHLITKDTGIGISPEYLKHIYETFSQESSGYTKNYQGVGLGLSLTKRYLDLIKARIDITSEKGSGSEIALIFDAIDQKQVDSKIEDDEPEALPSTAKITDMKVLVVEDDVYSQHLIKYQLNVVKNLRISSTLESAIEMINDSKPDIIFLDLSLNEDISGLELVRYLRQRKEYSAIPVIALTAHVFISDRLEAIQAGCTDYLTKPVKRKILIEKMIEHCG